MIQRFGVGQALRATVHQKSSFDTKGYQCENLANNSHYAKSHYSWRNLQGLQRSYQRSDRRAPMEMTMKKDATENSPSVLPIQMLPTILCWIVFITQHLSVILIYQTANLNITWGVGAIRSVLLCYIGFQVGLKLSLL